MVCAAGFGFARVTGGVAQLLAIRFMTLMKTFSPGLKFTLRELVGTPLRFAVLLVCQVAGFVLTILHLGLSTRQVLDLAFWGLITPILLLITLRRVVVESQRGSPDGKPSAEGYGVASPRS